MELGDKIKLTIRDVNDFPQKGIVFKDISTILLTADLCNDIVAYLAEKHKNSNLQGVAGIESRGFLFGFPLAMALGIPFIMIRKKGKLPYDKISYAYQLEYGFAEIEMHSDAFSAGDRILIHDDLLATGGSAAAAAELIAQCNGVVAGFDFLVELTFLKGATTLERYGSPISSIVQY
ncbi:MAG: adenine phosphoribosyltransferase [Bacteroidetes bacterium]|nr:adenine phosphoribosyltransferase [Bacteroidota bacterium]